MLHLHLQRKMSAAHFLKHLPCYNFSRRFLLRHWPSSTPLTLLSASSITFTTCTTPLRPSSSSSSSSSFSSYSARRQPFTSPYLSVRVHCPKHVADTLSEALLCFGASSVSIESLDEEEDTSEDPDEICIDSIFPVSQEVSVCISQAADSIGLKEIPRYEVQMVEQYNWLQKTQESFEPVEVAERLWIVPEWRNPPV